MKLLTKELKLAILFIIPTIIITFSVALTNAQDSSISAVSNYSMLIGTILALQYLKKENVLESNKKIFSKPNLIIFILFLIIGLCWTVFSSQLFFAIFPYSEEEMSSMTIHDILGTIIIAPLSEELVFRFGFVELGKKYGKVLPVAILSIVVFTIIHFPDIPSAFSILGAAFIYVYIYIKTNNIWYSMIAHFINNLLSVIAFYYSVIENTILGANSLSDLNNVYFIASSILMLICFLLLNRKLSNRK
ncbi:MAG: CPBP family intramembrane metalloprotease [Ruminococcus sp.]|nr:CPBP family intramembrane metalloprotease [Ruminococcus sp.]